MTLVVLFSRCAPDTQVEERDFVEVRVSGDTTIRTAQRALHPNGGEFVADLVIGMTDGPEEYLFGLVTSVAAGRDGSIYVLDPRVPTVRRFDAQGRHLRQIGRRGGGPGEFQRPTQIGITADSRLLVTEALYQRIHVYDTAGTYIRTLHAPAYNILGSDDDRIYIGSSEGVAGMIPIVIDTLGTPVDTVPVSPEDESAYIEFAATSPMGAPRRELLPYANQRKWAWSPQGYLITGETRRYALDIHRGDSIVSIRRNVPAVPVPAAQRELMRSTMISYLRQQYRGQSIPDIVVPESKPAFHTIEAALDGRIWVAVTGESVQTSTPNPRPGIAHAAGWNEYRSYDIFEPDGTYVGRVPLPDPDAGTRVRVMRGDTIWAHSRNADDAPIVVRYHIVWH